MSNLPHSLLQLELPHGFWCSHRALPAPFASIGPLRLLLVVYRPSERLEDPTAGTGLGIAEDRVMAVAADCDRFTGVE